MVSSGSHPTPFTWTGQLGYLTDLESRVYVRRRTYSSNRGRWNSPDPLLFADGPNTYQAFRNRPLSVQDPDGMLSFDFTFSRNNDDLRAKPNTYETARVAVRVDADLGGCSEPGTGPCGSGSSTCNCKGKVLYEICFTATSSVNIYQDKPVPLPLPGRGTAFGFFQFGRSGAQLEVNTPDGTLTAPLTYNRSGAPCGKGDTLSGCIKLSHSSLEPSCNGGSFAIAVQVANRRATPPAAPLTVVLRTAINNCAHIADLGISLIHHTILASGVDPADRRSTDIYRLVGSRGMCPNPPTKTAFPAKAPDPCR